MLDPDYLEQAGEKVASVYAQIESEMLDYLAARMISGDITNQKSQTALLLLAQSATTELTSFITKHKGEISASVMLEVKDALIKSDKDDLSRIKKGLGVNLPSITSKQIAATVAGVERILARRNIDMTNGAKNAFLTQSIWAVTQVNTGAMTTERALHKAVRALEREGISLISYKNAKTGVQTVKNKLDVAIRRHIRTQIAQDSMRRTEQVLDEAGVDLVEVSSHGGSRPSHAKWEGRIYSRHGDKVINGVKYKDFKTACKWGDIADGIGGANCRHSFAVYFPGMERSYEPDPKHPSGKSNEEVYELTQKQRYFEREIRATKRELKGAELLYKENPTLENQRAVSDLKARLNNKQAAIRNLVRENDNVLQRSPRREWAGDMPKVKVPKGSGRKLDEFLESKAAKAAMAKAGVSKTKVKGLIADGLQEQGGKLKDFPMFSAKEQQNIFKDALTRRKPTDIEIKRKDMKPVNESLYNSQKNYVERHGGIVIRGGEEVEKHLNIFGADASQIGGSIFLRSDATTSEVLEEVYHFQQEMRGDYKEYDADTMRLLREIDAQRYLLSVSKQYNIPEDEIRQTEKALSIYLKQLKEAGFNENS